MRCLVRKSSDVIRSLEDCKMDVKSFVFIKAPRIENVINARQHFFAFCQVFLDIFYFIFLIYLKLTTLPAMRVDIYYPPSRTDGAANGGRSAFTCCWLARLVWFVYYLDMFYLQQAQLLYQYLYLQYGQSQIV